ncbi:sulfite exporter TauE/SafE family protein [Gymnodinialimonas sp. 2305UL16-5]|uniref:sulfite exporter TauE/SafE family protein n=1 Tax=Gymnodinialimonas mytili TaxID=3126503 RepID=UPI0030A2F466
MGFWIIAGLAAFVLGLSKGGMPVVAILSVPLMSLYMDPALAAGLLLPLYLVADVYAIYLFRRDFSVRNLAILLPAAPLGVLGGYFAVTVVSTDATKLLLAAIGLSYIARSVTNRLRSRTVPARPADVPRGVIWGAVAGLTSYIAHAGGPPYQTYVLPQKLDKMVYLGTTAIFFAAVNLMKLPAYILADQLDWASVAQAAWLAPFALAGAFSGAKISRWLPDKVFFALIELALAVVSVKLLVEGVTGLLN